MWIYAKNKVIKLLKNKKLLIVFTIVLFFTIIGCPMLVQALSDPTEDPGNWNPVLSNDLTLNRKIGNVLGIVNVIGIVVAVIVLMVLGVKYMFGSVEEKADFKKSAILYVIGMLMLVSITTIANVIYKIATATGFFG